MAEGRDRRDPLASLAPLAKQARSIWAMLRQESNVDLGAIRLAGSSTSRHVELDVSVDGAPGSALGVMSQGEVNALALAVFLPRPGCRQPVPRYACVDLADWAFTRRGGS
jgi:hypothetical protein